MEKYLKAIFCLHGQIPPRTHDLGRLINQLPRINPPMQFARPEILAMTDYAVALRYESDFWPTQIELADALVVVRQLRHEILAVIPEEMRPAE